jgi:hypothetical protein
MYLYPIVLSLHLPCRPPTDIQRKGCQNDHSGLKWCPVQVRRDSGLGGEWARVGDITKVEIPHRYQKNIKKLKLFR